MEVHLVGLDFLGVHLVGLVTLDQEVLELVVKGVLQKAHLIRVDRQVGRLVFLLVWGLEVLNLLSRGYRVYPLVNPKVVKVYHLDFLLLKVHPVLVHDHDLKDNIEEAKNV